MKKIKLILLTLIILLPIKANAASLSLTCPTNATSGTTINCSLSTTDNLKGLKLNFSLPSEITINEIKTTWKGYYTGDDGLVVSNNNSGQKIADISLDISEEVALSSNYNINLINIEASDNTHKLVNIENVTKTLKIVSDDNTLSKLTITNGSLSPKFNKSKTSYTATINSDKTTVTATPSSTSAKVSGNVGEVKLNYGVNKLRINVTSELGTTRTYSIDITRPFSSQTSSTTKGSNSTTKNNNSTNRSNNTQNNNSTSNNNSTQNNNNTTTDTTTSSNAEDVSLKSLKVKDFYIDFNPNKFTYKLSVKNNVTSLDITAIPTNDKAKVEIEGPETLEVGENSITITITKEDGTASKYELIVTRQKEKDTKDDTKTTGKDNSTSKEIPFLPSTPLAITILIVIGIIVILFIIKKRIFNKEN